MQSIDDDTAIVTLTHVDYRSAAFYDMRAVNDAAHAAGALTVWDLSHSAGAVALDLDGTGCDLAVGCGYKYLNGGPGAPAFLYVAERLQDELRNPLQGWMGHAEPFAFDDDYRPVGGIARFLTGTPSVLALAALDAGLDTFAGISMRDVEGERPRALAAVHRRGGGPVRLRGAPRLAARRRAQRGSHVVFAHPQGYAVMQALIARGVIGDFRAPDLMRFGFAPLYNRFAEIVRAAEILAEILSTANGTSRASISARRSPDRRVPRPRCLDAPRTRTRGGEIKEDEAKQDRTLTHVGNRPRLFGKCCIQ